MSRLLVLASAALLVVLCTAGWSAARASSDPVAPPGDTIVDITGDAANGFHITHHDGTTLFPPTGSEARAECGEYDTAIARVRCRTEVRTWYRDLAATQQALTWAHAAP